MTTRWGWRASTETSRSRWPLRHPPPWMCLRECGNIFSQWADTNCLWAAVWEKWVLMRINLLLTGSTCEIILADPTSCCFLSHLRAPRKGLKVKLKARNSKYGSWETVHSHKMLHVGDWRIILAPLRLCFIHVCLFVGWFVSRISQKPTDLILTTLGWRTGLSPLQTPSFKWILIKGQNQDWF